MTVDGAKVAQQGVCIDPATAVVCVDGKAVAVQRTRYWLVYKPRGVVSTCHDPEGRRTVLDLLPANGERLYPVGRLDFDSEGLLLLTNDGALALRLTHPRHEIDKVYLVQTPSELPPEALDRARRGVDSEGEHLCVAAIAPERPSRYGCIYRVVLRQGRKRQIRRIFTELGHSVTRLTRVSMGPLKLGMLKAGEWRELSAWELAGLYRAGGLEGGRAASDAQRRPSSASQGRAWASGPAVTGTRPTRGSHGAARTPSPYRRSGSAN